MFLSIAICSSIRRSTISPRITSFHLFFGLPLSLRPSNSTNFEFSPALLIWPNHLNLPVLKTTSNPHLCATSSLGTLSSNLTPAIDRTILRSHTLRIPVTLSVRAQVSAPYTRTERMQASYTPPRILGGIPLFVNMGEISLHFIHTAATLPLTVLSRLASASNTFPRNPFTKMATSDRVDMWSERWKEGKSGWQLSDINPILDKYSSKLVTSSAQRIFIPLCGKSVDISWFYSEGHTVVGVEGVELPVKEFFKEHSLSPMIEDLGWAKLYKTPDERLKIYICDLFQVNVQEIGQFDAIWDRGSLVAIYEEDRISYAKLLKQLVKKDFRYLLATFTYTPTERFSGPPRNVPVALVKELFDGYSVEVLEVKEMYDDEKAVNTWQINDCCEIAVLIQPKL